MGGLAHVLMLTLLIYAFIGFENYIYLDLGETKTIFDSS